MRTITVFYAWQSDTPQRFNRHLIRIALEAAAERINQDTALKVEVRIDADTEGVPGQPPITETILGKIANCDIFVPDVTFVAKTDAGKLIPNPNVMTEYGYAIRARTYSAMMPVMNTAFGPPEKLPFDMAHLRHPIQYSVEPTAKDAERRTARNALASEIETVLRLQIVATQPPRPLPPPFPKAAAKDGPARFRAAGEPLGRRWDMVPFAGADQEILLAAGPAFWLRLMPALDPGKKWPAYELKEHAIHTNNITLAPFVFDNLFYLRAEDGFALCQLMTPQARDTSSVAFVFDTGEVWSIDTTLLTSHPGTLPFLEPYYIKALESYARLLSSLGLKPPFRWIGGVTGVNDRRLQIPPAPGKRLIPGWPGPQCLSDTIVEEGAYDGQQTPASSLLPLFKAIFDKCGTPRPDHLPQ
jgi:hypothetical protein